MKLNRINSGEKKKIIFFSIFLLVFIIFIAGLPRLSIPLMIAYVLYLVTEPIIPQIMKLGVGRSTAVILIFITVGTFSIFPMVKLVPTIKTEMENIEYYLPKVDYYLKTKYEDLRADIKKSVGLEIGDDFLKDALVYLTSNSKKFLLSIPQMLASFFEWLLVIPFILFFFLRDGVTFKRILLRLTPNAIFERFYHLSNELNSKIGNYIFAKFVEAGIVGIIIFTGLLLMGVRFSLLLGIIAAVTNIIPYIGPFFGLMPALVLGLVEHGAGSPQFSGILILYLIANVIDLGFVFPILVSKMVNLHPIIVVISVILGSHYLGIIGMIISIPLAAALKLVILQVYQEVYGPKVRQ